MPPVCVYMQQHTAVTEPSDVNLMVMNSWCILLNVHISPLMLSETSVLFCASKINKLLLKKNKAVIARVS